MLWNRPVFSRVPTITPQDYKADQDPSIFKSEKTGRGPLGPDWKVPSAPALNHALFTICKLEILIFMCTTLGFVQSELPNNPNCPHMCAYKLVTVEFKWLGLQNRIENYIQKVWND